MGRRLPETQGGRSRTGVSGSGPRDDHPVGGVRARRWLRRKLSPFISTERTQTVCTGHPAIWRGRRLVQGDAKLGLVSPTAYEDVFDYQPQWLLSLLEVEVVNGGADPLGEFGDSLTQGVLLRQLRSLGDQRVALVL